MDLFALASLKGQAANLNLSDPDDKFVPFMKSFGVSDPSLVSKILAAARMASGNTEQTVASFVSDGGLIRLLAGQKAEEKEDHVLQCPHCEELIIL